MNQTRNLMDKGALTDVLEAVLTRVRDVSIATPDVSIETPEGRLLLTETRETKINQELAEIVLPVLKIQPEFKDKAPMINTGAGSFGFQSPFVAPMLVREARHRKSAEAAVAWLAKVLGTDSAAGLAIQTLWGMSPTQRIPLSEDVDLLPFESLPPSRQKERLTNVDWPHNNMRLPTPFFSRMPLTAALVAKTEVRPFLIDGTIEENSTNNGICQVRPPLDDIRLCLALQGPSPIIAGLSWFQYVDPDLEAAILVVGGRHSGQEVLPFGFLAGSPAPTTDMQAIVRAYMALEPAIRNRVRIALERLHKALIRSTPADRALELSIALEALLIDSRGEHTFKLAYRAALLVSEDVEERIETRAIIGAIYGMRSDLMHGGQHSETVKVIKGQEKEPAEEVASRAAKITALVIKRIILEGGPPEWNQFELSDGRIWKIIIRNA